MNIQHLATRMAHGNLREFDPKKESIEDFRERFDFYCLANNVRDTEENQRRKKALFITVLGQATYAKLKVLANPTSVSDLTLDAIMEHLIGHFRPQTIEIAERFKFFKRNQREAESASEFMAELRSLAKTCNFGEYLESAIRDQFVCGLCDTKCQQELLCQTDLTAGRALQRARASEAVHKETESMQVVRRETEKLAMDGDTNVVYSKATCYRCGKQGHSATDCKFKTAKCHTCQKAGHLARVCLSRRKHDHSNRPERASRNRGKAVLQLQDDDSSSSSSSAEGHLHTIFQLGKDTRKFLVSVYINGVKLVMEIDSGAERTTIPWSIFQDSLGKVCDLTPTSITLHQYDQSPLKVKGQCQVTVKVNERVIEASFVVVDVSTQYPLFGRDWMSLLGFDVSALIQEATQVLSTSVGGSTADHLCSKYADVFKEDLGVLRGIEATVSVDTNATPKFHRYRPVPFAVKDKVEKTLKAQVAEGELIPVETSEWAAPIVVVHKRDGDIRICGDFKLTVNPVICPQVYPLPSPEELFSALANGESYSKLDLARAYKQMKVTESSQPLLTINTHMGLFKYARLPFGISTAPSLWQRAMAQVLQGIPNVLFFIDDILVTGRTRKEHEATLCRVLDRIHEYGLRLKRSKCLFFQEELEFLGHIISKDGVKPTQNRIKGIQQTPTPRNKQELLSFLGMITFNAKFLPSLSHVLHPLHQLLQKHAQWVWEAKHEQAFTTAKQLLRQDCMLTHYDVNKPLKLFCDASPYGLGACLVHILPNGDERPIAYASRTLTSAEKNYAQIEREALAIIFAVRRFHQYVYGRSFTLVTDHRPLCKILGEKEGIPPLAAARMQRWALLLSAYQYKIQHIPGSQNHCADCMSRLPDPHEKCDSAEKIHSVVMTEPMPILASQIAKATEGDKELATVLTAVQHGQWPSRIDNTLTPYYNRKNDLAVVDGCLTWGRRVIIPKAFRKQLLEELHSNHLGMSKMKSLARSYLWWPQLNTEIEALARNCQQCCAVGPNPPAAPAHPWLVPQTPWERLHIDHAQWKKWLLLVTVDAFSKWPEVFVVNSTSASQTTDKLRTIFAAHGLPVTIVSDNGPPFSSTDFEKFVKANGIIHRRVPPYHPSSNGLAENMVKSLKQALSKASTSESIETKIAKFLASYRNTPHSITGRTPAKVLLGRSPRTRLSLIHPCMSQRMSIAIEERVDNKSPQTFTVGEAVLLRDLRPSAASKWRAAFISCRLGPLAYEVNIDGQTRQAHIDHLKPNPELAHTNPDPDVHITPTQNNQPPDESPLADQAMEDSDSMVVHPFLLVDDDTVDIDSEQRNVEPHQRPQRQCKPTRRLIEEMP